MIAKQSLPEPLSADAMASVDRMLDACDCIEADLVHVVTSRCVEPYAHIGETLLFKRSRIFELQQFDLVWVQTKNQDRPFLAYAGVVSVTGMWATLCNAHPSQLVTLFHNDIVRLYRCVGRRA